MFNTYKTLDKIEVHKYLNIIYENLDEPEGENDENAVDNIKVH